MPAMRRARPRVWSARKSGGRRCSKGGRLGQAGIPNFVEIFGERIEAKEDVKHDALGLRVARAGHLFGLGDLLGNLDK